MKPPPLIPLSDFGGDWSKYEEALYEVFLKEIAKAPLTFRGQRVSCRRLPEARGKWASFWHLVQEGRIEDDRLPDLRRCERIRWVRFVIEAADSHPDIEWWENRRGPERNVVLWYREEYLVILAYRRGYWLLKSAYCTDKHHRRESLRRERDAFWAARNG